MVRTVSCRNNRISTTNINCLHHEQTRGHKLSVAAVLSRTAESRCPGGQGTGDMSRYHDVARRGQRQPGVLPPPLSPLSRPVDSSHYSRGAGRPRTVCAAHAHQPQLHLRLRNSSAARPGRRSCSGCRGWTVARPTRNSVLGCSAAVFWPSSQ